MKTINKLSFIGGLAFFVLCFLIGLLCIVKITFAETVDIESNSNSKGFYITENLIVMTNHGLLDEIPFVNNSYFGKIVYRNAESDIAFIKTARKTKRFDTCVDIDPLLEIGYVTYFKGQVVKNKGNIIYNGYSSIQMSDGRIFSGDYWRGTLSVEKGMSGTPLRQNGKIVGMLNYKQGNESGGVTCKQINKEYLTYIGTK